MKRLFVTFTGQKQNWGEYSNPWHSLTLEAITTDKDLKGKESLIDTQPLINLRSLCTSPMFHNPRCFVPPRESRD